MGSKKKGNKKKKNQKREHTYLIPKTEVFYLYARKIDIINKLTIPAIITCYIYCIRLTPKLRAKIIFKGRIHLNYVLKTDFLHVIRPLVKLLFLKK